MKLQQSHAVRLFYLCARDHCGTVPQSRSPFLSMKLSQAKEVIENLDKPPPQVGSMSLISGSSRPDFGEA